MLQEHEIKKFIEAVAKEGEWLCGDDTPEDVASEWIEYDFDLFEARLWWSAKAFCAISARYLDVYMSPEQAAQKFDDGETIAFKYSNCDISMEQAIHYVR